MANEDVRRSISPASSSGRRTPIIALGRQPRRQQVEDEPRRQDKTYRRYAAGIQGALASFDSTRLEWPDYISFLGRLLKAIQSHPPAVNDIPHKDSVANRLAQCLNPALPSGVHQKAIEVYSYIFSLIGKENLTYDLHIYLPGLSPVLTFASLSLRPFFLTLFETHIINLDSNALRPALRALLLGLLPGLEEENSEEFDRTLRVIDDLKNAITVGANLDRSHASVSGAEHFWQCLFLAAISSASRRQGALAYLQKRLPKFHARQPATPLNTDRPSDDVVLLPDDVEPVISPEPGLLIRCLAAGLGDDQVLLQRGYLDLLLTHLPLNSPIFSLRVNVPDLEHLIFAATGVVARRDMSLNRRLWMWFLGPHVNNETQEGGAPSLPLPSNPTKSTSPGHDLRKDSSYFAEFGSRPLINSLLKMLRYPGQHASERARPFRIFLSLMDRAEIGTVIVPRIFIPAIESLLEYKHQATHEDFQEVLRSASAFFDGIESRPIWAQMLRLCEDSMNLEQFGEQWQIGRLNIVDFIIENFNVREEEMLTVHIPLVAGFLISAINESEEKSAEFLSSSKTKMLMPMAIDTLDKILELLPESTALLKRTGNGTTEEADTLPKDARRAFMARVKGFYFGESNEQAAPPPSFFLPSRTAEHLLMESMAAFVNSLEHDCPPRSTLARSKVLSVLISKLPELRKPGLRDLVTRFQQCLPNLNRATGVATAAHVPFATLTAITQVITQAVVSGSTLEHVDVSGLPTLINCIVQHLWLYLSPTFPKYHLEAVRLIWQLDDLIPTNRTVEASVASIFVAAQDLHSESSPKLESARRFTTLWAHTTTNYGAQSRRANSIWSKQASAGPDVPIVVEIKEHETRLERPMLLLLDASQEGDSALGFFLRDWLATLPNLGDVFGMLLQAAQQTLQTTTLSDSSAKKHIQIQVQETHMDCRADTLYYFQHILRLLRIPSSHLWTTLTQAADARSQKVERATLLESITDECLQLIENGSRLPPMSIQEIDVQLQRTALTILQVLLRNPNSIRLQKIHLEDALIDILIRVTGSVTAHPSLQVALLDSVTAALELRLVEVPGEQPRVYPSTPVLDSPKTLSKPEFDTVSLKESTKSRGTAPPAQLIKCLIGGISSSSSVHALENWIKFLTEVLPLFGDVMFQNMIPLVDCFCTKIRTMFNELKTVFKNDNPEHPVAPEAALLSLLSGFEFVLTTGHERLAAEEYRKAVSKPQEPTQGFLSNVVSGVFSSDMHRSRTAVANTRLMVILCFQDAVKNCLAIWSWGVYGQDAEGQDATSISSFGYFSQRLRNRAKRILDRMFGAESLECLETLVVLWTQQGALSQKSRATPVFSLLQVLDSSRPKNIMPAIFNSIYSRTNPSAIEPNRMSSLTSDITDMELGQFLTEYTQSLDEDTMDEIWSDCMAFLKDVLVNPLPHHNILPSLLVFVVTLTEKMENTNFGDQRKMRRDMSELFTRLLSAIFTMRSGGSLQEPAQAVFAGEKLANGETALGKSARRRTGQADLVGNLSAVLPRLTAALSDVDKVVSVVSNISTNLITLNLHAKAFPENMRPGFLLLMLNLTIIAPASKIWKKDILDALNNPKFFSSPVSMVKDGWLPLLAKLVANDKDRISDLCSRISPPTAAGNIFGVGASTARLEADKRTQYTLRRIALLIFAAEQDYILSSLGMLEEKLSELLNATAASSPSAATRAELFMVIRAVILRTSFIHLGALWPMVTAELQRAIASAVPRSKDYDMYNAPSLLQACKLLDLLLVVTPDEFQMHEWLFITDTIEAVYRPAQWDPVALVDELAEDLGSSGNIVPSTPAEETPMLREVLLKTPLLASNPRVAELRKEDFVQKILGPFFAQLSIHAYESTYSMQSPDLKTCEDILLDDLFDDSTIVG